MAISAGSLVALFGDELDEVGSARLGTTTMPGRDLKVSAKDLAGAAVALTVWDLITQGALRQRVETKKRLLGSATKVWLHAAATSDGFAGAVLGAAAREVELRELVLRMLGGEAIDPSSRLLGLAQAELAAIGVLTATEQGRAKTLLKAMAGRSLFQAIPGADAPLRAEWEALRDRWCAARADDPTGHDRLVDGARRAIERATTSVN